MSLSARQLEQFGTDGYVFPVDVFTVREAATLRRQLEDIESRIAGQSGYEAALRNHADWVIPMFAKLTRERRILDAIEGILGPDILALHVDLFIKEARTPDFISWHQDLHYWGLDSDQEVTAWLALSPATMESGCMRFMPGSHRQQLDHRDTFADDNMLTRGQEVAAVDDEPAVAVELAPGQMSLHHGRLLHASYPNKSDDRRIGVAIRFITPEMKLAKTGDNIGATLVRGVDSFGHFELLPSPREEFEQAAMQNWQRLRVIEDEIIYAGVKQA